MDPQTTYPAPESLAATLQNAAIDKTKRSDFSHTARSHPLTGTETPALHRSLNTPDDGYTPVLATISLTLPRELVESILLLLDAKSMLKCKLVNREFNAIIQSSTLMQYDLACNAAGIIDNPQSPLSYNGRLVALKKWEYAWRELKPMFETTIKTIDRPSAVYELTAGNYFLSDENGTDLYYCHLPSSIQNRPQWRRIADHSTGQSWFGSIAKMGMAIYEHDLVVKAISPAVGNQADMEWRSIDLVLLKFPTGEYHPLARHPLIHVQISPSAQFYIAIRIVGDNLALVVHDLNGSKLFIFDWKTGHKRLKHRATENAYEFSVPVFVSPELIIVPNRSLSHLEVWHLFPSHPDPNPPIQILSLQIPAVSDNYSIVSIRCHGDLSSCLPSMPYFPPRPFFPSSENSIIIISLLFEPLTDDERRAYQLIMHRRALLDMIQKWISPSILEQEYPPTWLTNQVTVHEVADPDDGLVRLGAQSQSAVLPHPGSSLRTHESPTLAPSQISPTFPTSHISAKVKWADWGPLISRWFLVNEVYGTQTWFAHQSTGQKYVFLDRNPRDKGKCMICVADFNLHNVKRNVEMMMQLRGRKCKDNGGNCNNKEEEEEENEKELEILDHEGVFLEKVYMGLKCVIYHAPGKYDFDVVMMDEERLLGLKIGRTHLRVDTIKVLYIG